MFVSFNFKNVNLEYLFTCNVFNICILKHVCIAILLENNMQSNCWKKHCIYFNVTLYL